MELCDSAGNAPWWSFVAVLVTPPGGALLHWTSQEAINVRVVAL